jgi:hypothetical protein
VISGSEMMMNRRVQKEITERLKRYKNVLPIYFGNRKY